MNRRELLLGVAALPLAAAGVPALASGDPIAAVGMAFDPATGPDVTYKWVARMTASGNWECIASGDHIPDIDAHMQRITDAAKAA